MERTGSQRRNFTALSRFRSLVVVKVKHPSVKYKGPPSVDAYDEENYHVDKKKHEQL